MTDQRELDRLLGAYFVDGTDELADRVIDAALDQIDHTRSAAPMRAAVEVPDHDHAHPPRRGRRDRRARGRRRLLLVRPAAVRRAAAPDTDASRRRRPGARAGAWPRPAPTSRRRSCPMVASSSSAAGVPAGSGVGRDLRSGRPGRGPRRDDVAQSRAFPTATRLADGKVLVVGGGDADGAMRHRGRPVRPGDAAPGPRPGQLTEWPEPARRRRCWPMASVLVAGGNATTQVGTAEIYDPTTATWTPTGNMTTWRASSSMTLLDDGRVLVAGGFSGRRMASDARSTIRHGDVDRDRNDDRAAARLARPVPC